MAVLSVQEAMTASSSAQFSAAYLARPLTPLSAFGSLPPSSFHLVVYKDVLQGAGIMDALLSCLTSASPLCDLSFTQDLLWILICLADDDVVYKDFMREEGVLEVLTALFSVYQAHSSLPEIRPIAAQMLR